MKKTYLLAVILLPLILNAQIYPFKTQKDQISFKVVNNNGQPGIQYDTLPKENGFPEIISLTLERTDLILQYEYKGLNKKYTPDVVKVISIQSLDERNTLPSREDLQQKDLAVSIKKGMKGTITWYDLAEEVLTLGESYILNIERNIQLDVNCEDGRPQFKFKDQWPHYAGAAAAVALIGLGQVYRKKKENEYDLYLDAWRNGESSDDAKPHLDKSDDYDRKTKFFTFTGYGLLLADAVWFYLRRKEVTRKQKLYDEFCFKNSDTTYKIQPLIELNGSQESDQNLTGLKILVTF